jgi:hypothetical protein
MGGGSSSSRGANVGTPATTGAAAGGVKHRVSPPTNVTANAIGDRDDGESALKKRRLNNNNDGSCSSSSSSDDQVPRLHVARAN